MQPYPQQPGPQYPYPQQPQPQQYAMQQPAYGYAMVPRGPKRNVALIVVGAIALFLGVLALAVVLYNAYQYSTVEDHFSDIEGAGWVVELVKEAALKRMMIFGPLALVFLGGGVVTGVLGLRKR
jgi:hypothetical protein